MTGMKVLISALFVFYTFLSHASDIKIGLFYGKKTESAVITLVEGKYKILGNDHLIGSFGIRSIFFIDHSDSGIFIHDAGHSYGPFDEISFIPTSDDCVFLARTIVPSSVSKESEYRLDITFYEGFLRLINTMPIEKYIPGTVEAEGGSNALPEYYKAQAVLARTFAVKNYLRHAHEGFNICDDVHCQAFSGKSRMNREIYKAVRSTEQFILTDKYNEPVITAYHSSCGGMTASASIEWNRDLDYLVPVRDPFCNKSKNLNWTKSVTKTVWAAYMLKSGYTGNDNIYLKEDIRKKYLDETGNILQLNAVRREFSLKSAWFYVEDEGSEVVFHGHGYGHGLGMCQEGAMEMARVGYTYVDILMFYFRGLKIASPPAP
jgi:stage II sporulation protein D